MVLTKKFEDYKSNKEIQCSFEKIKIRSQKVWEIENDLNLMSMMYGLVERQENHFHTHPEETVKEIEKKLADAENYFEEKKLLLWNWSWSSPSSISLRTAHNNVIKPGSRLKTFLKNKTFSLTLL